MNNIHNVNPNLDPTIATLSGQADGAKTAAAGKQVAPLLGGPSVSVTQAPSSDLEKLVAKLKNENDDRQASLARQRLSALLNAYTARYGALSDQQTQVLEEIAANNDAIAKLMPDYQKAQADLAYADAQMVIMQAKIDEVQHAVDRAVAEGKAHREAVAKLKEQLARDVDNEDLKAELAKEEATVSLLEEEKGNLDKELHAAISQAAAQEAKLDTLHAAVDELKGKIASLEASNKALAGKLDSQTITNLLAAFSTENTIEPVERTTSAAEEAKAELKAIANDPANLIREAMDRMDAAILQTIDENREKPV